MPVTIRDVAAAVGVSPSTVSRAFGRPDKVDAETRTRVLAAAARLDYRPNRAAQTLNSGRTGCLGAVLPDLENPFFAGLLKGIDLAARRVDYQTLVADTGEDVRAERRAVNALRGQVDGLLLCSSRLDDDELLAVDRELPLVLVNRRVPGISHVSFDNAQAMRDAVTHLRALGHDRIGYVGGNLQSRSARERLAAFRSMADAGLELVVLGEFAPTFDGGARAADAAMAAQVSSVVVYNDVMAIGLINRLLGYGVELPAELSVVGCDNVPVAAMVRPALTTMDLPRVEAGRIAAETLYRLLDGRGPERAQRVLAPRLTVRESTRRR